MKKTSLNRLGILILFAILIIGFRAIAPLSPDFAVIANFSGLGAVAIFSGSFFKNKISGFIYVILVLLLSDLILGVTMGKENVFYSGWIYTYLAFIGMVAVGQFFVKNVNVKSVASATVLGVFIHWIVADFGVWFGSPFYPQTLAGFGACLIAAIPFELKFLYGTILYTTIMFGAFELLKAKFPALNAKATIA